MIEVASIIAGIICLFIAALFCLSASYAASRPTPPLCRKLSTRRQPGETDSDMADRLLNASPFHQAALQGRDEK